MNNCPVGTTQYNKTSKKNPIVKIGIWNLKYWNFI